MLSLIPDLRDSDVACGSKPKVRLGSAGRAPILLERTGPFEIRLASTAAEVRQAQKLRYRVFYEEGGAIASPVQVRERRDICAFDEICDHLLVVDTRATARSGKTKDLVVGTYRLLRRRVADRYAGFYSCGEFDLDPLLSRHPRTEFLELGRSCVHAGYRSKRVIEMLWRGLWLYAEQHGIDALIGCASLPGTDLDALRLPLSFLLADCQASPLWQVAAWPHTAAKFARLLGADIERRHALMALPPLLRAYLKAGARFGINAVVDHQFGTVDVFAVLPMRELEDRYLTYYGQPSCVSGKLTT